MNDRVPLLLYFVNGSMKTLVCARDYNSYITAELVKCPCHKPRISADPSKGGINNVFSVEKNNMLSL